MPCTSFDGRAIHPFIVSKLLVSCLGALAAIATLHPSSVLAQSRYLTGQGGGFSLSSSTVVRYGANNAFNAKTLASGSYICGDQLFGDPAPGLPKSCFADGASAPAPELYDHFGLTPAKIAPQILAALK